MRALILLALSFSAVAQAETKIVEIFSSKSVYNLGETVILRSMLLTKPDNENYELEVLGDLGGNPLSLERVTEFESFAAVEGLTPGTYTFSANVVIQDARLARDFKESIRRFQEKIAAIDAELATNPPPDRVEELLAEKARFEQLLQTTQGELSRIRTKIHGPVTLNFDVI